MARKKPHTTKKALILSGGGARGAYHAGVWKYLAEQNWVPDIICGSSSGALNAIAIGCGLTSKELIHLWESIQQDNIFNISILKQITNFFCHRGFYPLSDSKSLKKIFTDSLSLKKLKKSKFEIVISAVHVLNSRLRFFHNQEIRLEHIMASCAIPIMFPWSYVDGEPYWDGGVMANTPLLPAIQSGANEIIVVLQSPVGGAKMPEPTGKFRALERLFEQMLIGSYESFLSHMEWDYKNCESNERHSHTFNAGNGKEKIKILTVSPENMLGFPSILRFTKKQAAYLINEGYNTAQAQLTSLFTR